MQSDSKPYTLSQYLLLRENYDVGNVESSIILSEHIWDDIFRRHNISDYIDRNFFNIYVEFNTNAISGKKIIHLIHTRYDSMGYAGAGLVLSEDVLNKIALYEREIKIDQLCKEE